MKEHKFSATIASISRCTSGLFHYSMLVGLVLEFMMIRPILNCIWHLTGCQ